MSYSPDEMFQALETAAEDRAKAEYQAMILEKNGEILLGELMWKERQDGVPASMCKEIARTKAEWRTHVKGEAEAVRQRSRARAKYENLKILAEARRTQEVTERALTR